MGRRGERHRSECPGPLDPSKSLARAPGLWGGTCIGFISPEELTCLSPPSLTLRLTPLPSHSSSLNMEPAADEFDLRVVSSDQE